jgi:hypothetical protein
MVRHTAFFAVVALLLGMGPPVYGQDGFNLSIPSNRTPASLEHNALFNAQARYAVTQTGAARFSLDALFDGRLSPSYTRKGVDPDQPTVITIEDLPRHYRQGGVWVGWTTRYWPAKHFKIEAYDIRDGYDDWRVIADYSSTEYDGTQFLERIGYNGIYTKVRYTFYEGRDGNYGEDGEHRRVGVSELLYINPEMGRPYRGFLSKDLWALNGNVGLGTKRPGRKLEVNGTTRTKEVIVKAENWPDYVFDEDYDLRSPAELAAFIEREGHLPALPPAGTIESKGQTVGTVQRGLVQTVEELARYAIDRQEQVDSLTALVQEQRRALKEKGEALDHLRERDQARRRRLKALERKYDRLREQVDQLPRQAREGGEK